MAALPPSPSAATTAPLDAMPWPRQVLRHVLSGTLVSLGVGLFLSLLFGDGLWRNLVISLCIGGCIQALIEVGRYTISAWMLRRGDRNQRVLKHWPGWHVMGPYVLVSALLGYALGRNLSAMLLGDPWPVVMQGSLRGLVLVLCITVVVSVVATYSIYMQSQLAASAAQAEAAQRVATDNQLRLLQSQLEPHMLFNTLANLRVLVTLDPPRAQAMLDHLIRYLRATLGASHARLHPLAAEFALLDDYLALMALRMGPRLQALLQLPEALRQLAVPPLLLQPLVENSIRHGLEPKVEGGRITVTAALQGDTLVLTVRDTGVGLDSAPAHGANADGGYGSRHVAERLATLYGAQASFVMQAAADADGGVLVSVRLPATPST